ncbi:hypothetical protein SMICM304S_08402 [Streptomyces microflavus]
MRTWRDGEGTLTVGGDAGARGVPLRIAASYRARTRGLLGRDGIDGALMLTPAGSVHTFRMRFAIDVAYLDRKFTVLAVRTMKPGRLGLPRLRSRHVVEAGGRGDGAVGGAAGRTGGAAGGGHVLGRPTPGTR